MDDRTRDDLLATLADARKREAHARERLQARTADVTEARAEHGNPYFFSARPADDPESQAHFTGYKSHEPAFALWREWQDVSQQIASISRRLQDAGIEPV
jgi:hypothetical protein